MPLFSNSMPNIIYIGSKQIPVTVKLGGSFRSIRINIKSDDASVVVTYGRLISHTFLRKYIESKSDWIEKKVEQVSKINPILRTKHSKIERQKYSKEAHKLVTKKLEEFNKYYKLRYKKVFIRNQKTKWGSCSSTKNLNFNYKIVLLPPHLQDYLIVHELCHLKEFNHGKAFWSLVGEKIQDYKALSKKLRVGDF